MTALFGSACASDQPTISAPSRTTGPAHVLQPIPSTALPGNSADPTDLDASSIASDAVDVTALEALLDQAGFVGGTQRQFSRVHGGRRRILARVLTFETPEGASAYVAWLGDHGDEVIGKATPSATLRVPRHGVVLVHEPNPCCHNETRMFLAMWHEGSTVVTIQIAGEGARETDVPELLSQLDAAV
ncbi:MAG TPA: hypothetical protein VGQ01_00285 [Actinomycetota bacterium]|nr:hypothetical protein [Actinomycetota bacterium]